MVTLVTSIIGIGVASLIIFLVRKDRLHVNHGLGWILIALGFAVVGLFPGIVDYVALKIGIAYPPVLALTLGIAILVIKILLMDIERSRMEIRHQRMIQRIAILEADLKQLRQSQHRSS
jgi:hypothetical protein